MAGELDLAEQLLRRAADDEAAAKALLPVKSVTNVIVGQHAQQGVEKAIKAILAAPRCRVSVHPRHRWPYIPVQKGGYTDTRGAARRGPAHTICRRAALRRGGS
jgi:hypothetical protein